MICRHVKKRYKGLCLSCPFWVVRRQMKRLSLLWRLIFLGHFFKPFWLSIFVCTFLLYGHPLSTDTSLLRTVCFVPWERKALIWTLSMTPSGSILKWFDCTENAKFTTSAWLKSINFNKISDYFLLLLLLLLTSFADGVTRNPLPCQSNNMILVNSKRS